MANEEKNEPGNGGDEPRLPTADDLMNVPRWARVAFAARCARRVQPLFVHEWPDAPAEHVEAVDRAITLAQASAASPASASESAASFRAAADAARAAGAADAASFRGAAADAAAAAADAARAAGAAAARAAAVRAARAVRAADADVTQQIVRDFALLRAAVEEAERDGKPWTDETPVPAEFFGPMWPEGEPEGWPEHGKEAVSGEQTLTLELEFPDDMSSQQIAEAVAEYYKKLDDLHRASGGSGLTLKRSGARRPVRVPVGEPA